jgi:hypothetical protein
MIEYIEPIPETLPSVPTQTPAPIAARVPRAFVTGATRDQDVDKYDYEGFLAPGVLERFAEYMHKHRLQLDGTLRDSDNWQRGIPRDAYMKSAWRHFMAVWAGHRTGQVNDEDLCALMFNVMGYLFELQAGR